MQIMFIRMWERWPKYWRIDYERFGLAESGNPNSKTERVTGYTVSEKNPNNEDGIYYLDSPIVLPGNFSLILDNCTLKMVSGVYRNMIVSEGVFDAMPAEKENIRIIGKGHAVLDQGEPNDLTEKTSGRDGRPDILYNCPILFRYVKDLEISNLFIKNQRYWGITLYYCSFGTISNIDFYADNKMPNQDGIDLRIGCHDMKLLDITGVTGDDSVALTALPLGEGNMVIPSKEVDIHHVEIGRVSTYISGGHQTVRLLNHDGAKLHHIRIHDIHDLKKPDQISARATVVVGDTRYFRERPASEGETHDIEVRHVFSQAKVGLEIRWNNVENLVYEDIVNPDYQPVFIQQKIRRI